MQKKTNENFLAVIVAGHIFRFESGFYKFICKSGTQLNVYKSKSQSNAHIIHKTKNNYQVLQSRSLTKPHNLNVSIYGDFLLKYKNIVIYFLSSLLFVKILYRLAYCT